MKNMGLLRGLNRVKPVNKMTDQELNEWVGEKLMGWKLKVIKASNGKIIRWHKPNNQVSWGYDEIIFFPAEDLNHTHLMEEKIREMKPKWEGHDPLDTYLFCLEHKFNYCQSDDPQELFKLIHASARQRCEAAFLAFGGKGE